MKLDDHPAVKAFCAREGLQPPAPAASVEHTGVGPSIEGEQRWLTPVLGSPYCLLLRHQLVCPQFFVGGAGLADSATSV
jgi:hypothetical protein